MLHWRTKPASVAVAAEKRKPYCRAIKSTDRVAFFLHRAQWTSNRHNFRLPIGVAGSAVRSLTVRARITGQSVSRIAGRRAASQPQAINEVFGSD
jgi:hypothetical protein